MGEDGRGTGREVVGVAGGLVVVGQVWDPTEWEELVGSRPASPQDAVEDVFLRQQGDPLPVGHPR